LRSSVDFAGSGGDVVLLRRTAHTLKSNAAMVGATALSNRLGTLEAAARSGQIDAALAAAVAAAADDYTQLIGVVKSLRGRYGEQGRA
jgi:HPt (histidine-containing phosphotransfer) domain-containing protein